jgi:hypothetical protein
VSSFLVYVASLLTTLAVYLSSISVLYVVLAKEKWWKLLRLDALCGAGILLVLDIAWFGRTVSDLRRSEYTLDSGLTWLAVIVGFALSLLAAGVFGVAMYVTPKLKKRTDLASGNVSPARAALCPALLRR